MANIMKKESCTRWRTTPVLHLPATLAELLNPLTHEFYQRDI